MEFVAIDIFGQLPTTKQKISLLLVITDRFSKLVETVRLMDMSPGTIAKALVDSLVPVHKPQI